MRFLTLEDCSDSELHCVYHDPERTVTVLHPRTACSLQMYAPQEEAHAPACTFQSRRPNATQAWWLQLLSITGREGLGVANSAHGGKSLDPDGEKRLVSNLTSLHPLVPNRDLFEAKGCSYTLPASSCSREPHTSHSDMNYLSYVSLLANNPDTPSILLAQSLPAVTKDKPSHGPSTANLNPRASRRQRMQSANIRCEAATGDRPGTPIIHDVGSLPLGVGGKRVRLCAKKMCVWEGAGGGEVRVGVEDVEDNEGKTAEGLREARGRKRGGNVRGRICWDSERGF